MGKVLLILLLLILSLTYSCSDDANGPDLTGTNIDTTTIDTTNTDTTNTDTTNIDTTNTDTVNTITTKDVARDLMHLNGPLSGIKSTLSMVKGKKSRSIQRGTRAISPHLLEAPDGSPALYTMSGGQKVAKLPSVVYSEYGGTRGKVTIPSKTTYLKSADGKEYQFDIDNTNAPYYQIKLYIYDWNDFYTYYVSEEYYVYNDAWTDTSSVATWPWQNLSYDNKTKTYSPGYDKKEIQTSDNTKWEEEINWTNDGGNGFAAFTFPGGSDGNILDNIDDYTYPSSITVPNKSSSVQFSVDVTRTVDNKKTELREFYTETSSSEYSGLIYTTTGNKGKWATNTNTVTYYTGSLSANQKSIRSMTTTGDNTPWYTETNVIEVSGTVDASRYELTRVYDYTSPENAKSIVNHEYEEYLIIDEDANGDFSGFSTQKWWGSGSKYTVSFTRQTWGKFKYSQTYHSDARSDHTTDSSFVLKELIIDVTQAINNQESTLQINTSINGNLFSGIYDDGDFVGTYTKNGKAFSVIITAQGVKVNDDLIKYNIFKP